MNLRGVHPEQKPVEFGIWDVLERIPGSDRREALEIIYSWARQCERVVVLSRASARSAAAAVLGVLASGSNQGPVRVYLTHPSRQQLMLLFSELDKLGLACDATLYHGSLSQFFRDLPWSAGLICASGNELVAGGGLHSILAAGTVILCLHTAPEAVHDLVASGIFQAEAITKSCSVFRTTGLCHGSNFVPSTGLRIRLQARLHERYFLTEASKSASYTPVADLVEDIRRKFPDQFPAASGPRPWPYTAPPSGGLPLTLPSGNPWPKISIVTPTRNQARYIEETILSVLHQDYPNAEHIIVDGASTDDTASILARYRDKLAFVISEPDNGQSHAINKGMSKATGEILTWLNGDDMLAPGALASVALAFDVNSADMISGICQLHRDGALEFQHLTSCADGPLPLEDLLDLDQGWNAGRFFIQPEVMFTREIWLRAGGQVNERLHYAMDYELWLRFARAGARLHVIGRPLAWFRLHEQQKISARSDVALELAACRDAFSAQSATQLKPAPPSVLSSWRQKLRITLLYDETGQGSGAAVRLAHALAWAGHEISMVAITGAERPELLKYSSKAILGRVSACRPDLVVVGNLRGSDTDSILLRQLAKRVPTLVVLQDPPAAKILSALQKKRQLIGTGRRPALLASSKSAAALAREAGNPSVELIRWSFALDFFRPSNKQSCRENFHLPADRFLILLADGLGTEGYALLEALDRLKLSNTSVVVIGSPAEDLPRPVEVVQLGDICDPHKLAQLYSAVDVVVAPSSAETFEQVHIEAIACGTPVAGCRMTAVPEAILQGIRGILASGNDSASLAAAIHHLYVHPELGRDMARWGPLYIENEWSKFSAYRQILLALERLGLAKSLNLRNKIEFRPDAPDIPLQSF